MDRRRLVLVLCCLAQFMVILDVSIVNVALPSISADLGFSGADLQWVVNAYTLTFAGFLLLGGRAADLLGRRRVFVAGLAAVRASRRWPAGWRRAQGVLVAARAVQGLGGAIVAPATLAILTTTFSEGAERNRALGRLGRDGRRSAARRARCSAASSPSCSAGSWILFVNVPIGAGAIAAAAPAGRGRRAARHRARRAASTSPAR